MLLLLLPCVAAFRPSSRPSSQWPATLRPRPPTPNSRIDAVKLQLLNATKSDVLSERDNTALGRGGMEAAASLVYSSFGGKSPTRKNKSWVEAVLWAPIIGRGGPEAAARLRAEQARPALLDWLQSLRREPRVTIDAVNLLLGKPAQTPLNIIIADNANANCSWLEDTVRFARKHSLSVNACVFAPPGAINAPSVISFAARGIRVVETLDPSATPWNWKQEATSTLRKLSYEPLGYPFAQLNGTSPGFSGDALRYFETDQSIEMSAENFTRLLRSSDAGICFLDLNDQGINLRRPVF